MRVVLVGFVVLVISALGAAGASANTGLVWSANGSPLTNGAELNGSSSLVVFSASPGSIECEEGHLLGELGVSGAEAHSAAFSFAVATGLSGAPCRGWGGKPAQIRGVGTPWFASLTPGVLLIKLMQLEVEIGTEVCHITVKGVKASYNLGGPLNLSFNDGVKGSGPCGKGGELSGTFALTSNGHPVEATYNSPPTGTLSGTVTDANGDVNQAGLDICNETTLICYTTETESLGDYEEIVPEGTYEVTAAPPGGGGDATVIEYGVEVKAAQTTTFSPVLPPGGTIKGTITEPSSQPVPGVYVSACFEECYESVTNSAGEYSMTVSPGEYEIEVSPPNGYTSLEAGPLTVAGGQTVTEDFTLTPPIPLPAGTTVQGVSSVVYNGHEIPIVHWEITAPIRTQACAHGTVEVTVTGENTETHTLETTPAITLTEVASGEFGGELPKLHPIHGEGTVSIKVTNCTNNSEDGTVEFTIYIDPSGQVVDGDDGNAPLSGATVTLLSGSKRTGPFAAVPNGSTVMSPGNRTNPDTTNALGEFGWDTAPGFYEVEASEAGCGTAVVGPFEVPPPQVGLKLVLHCTVRVDTTSLPEATLGQPYSATLAASGTEMPFKWKKLKPLPKGLKLSKTGVLSGTMKASKVTPGTYPIEVQVTNHAKESAKATLQLKVG